MRYSLVTAPWWVLFLVTGLPSGLAFGLLLPLVVDLPFLFFLLSGIFGGLAFGTGMTLFAREQFARWRHLAGPLETREWVVVGRALGRGPLPEQHRLRTAAVRVADDQLSQLGQFQRPYFTVFAFLVLLQLFFAVTKPSWFHAALAAGLTGLLISQRYTERRLRRRRDLLATDPPIG